MRSSLNSASVSVVLCGAIIIAIPLLANVEFPKGAAFDRSAADTDTGVLFTSNNFDGTLGSGDSAGSGGSLYDSQKMLGANMDQRRPTHRVAQIQPSAPIQVAIQ